MKKITVKKLIITFVSLLFIQFVVLMFTDEVKLIGYESKKAFEEFEKENPGNIEKVHNSSDKKLDDKLILEIAKKIALEERIRLLKDSKVRAFMFTQDKTNKKQIISYLESEIEHIKTKNPDSYKIVESEHEIEVMKKGYNPISFIMEKILGLKSTHLLINQNNYFFIIMTFFLFLVLITIKLIRK